MGEGCFVLRTEYRVPSTEYGEEAGGRTECRVMAEVGRTPAPSKGIPMIELLEELAGNAWPAPVQQQLEGWRLRAAGNVTRRANSVLAVGAIPEYGEWLEEVMRFYRCRGLPVRFHVSDASPEGLEGMLEGMGYLAQAHTSVQVVRCEVVLERSVGAGEFEVVGFDGLDAGWLDSFMRIEGHSESKRAMYEAILGSIGPRRRFV